MMIIIRYNVTNALDGFTHFAKVLIKLNLVLWKWELIRFGYVITSNSSYTPVTHFSMKGDEYLCPKCRIFISQQLVEQLSVIDEEGLSIFAEPVTEVSDVMPVTYCFDHNLSC
jgi:hypothetical protein